MSLLTRAYILEQYGVRLGVAQLSEVLRVAEGTIRNQISADTFPVPTYVEGGRRFASYDAIASYLDAIAQAATFRGNNG
ncbi:hypothetical protein [Pandoraea commovens]|uniref:DNA-binding protein n=1 Tax=Pandoraea commovens TaxID=2508289 RepID=A0A5E4T2R6_9BURK|nr:hypothetical protein [Pandoraea commovens]VVD82390.1 hypothetical protein PCO31010_01218 [Pandoraea commovens]